MTSQNIFSKILKDRSIRDKRPKKALKAKVEIVSIAEKAESNKKDLSKGKVVNTSLKKNKKKK